MLNYLDQQFIWHFTLVKQGTSINFFLGRIGTDACSTPYGNLPPGGHKVNLPIKLIVDISVVFFHLHSIFIRSHIKVILRKNGIVQDNVRAKHNNVILYLARCIAFDLAFGLLVCLLCKLATDLTLTMKQLMVSMREGQSWPFKHDNTTHQRCQLRPLTRVRDKHLTCPKIWDLTRQRDLRSL